MTEMETTPAETTPAETTVVGVNETLEMILATGDLGAILIKHMKDGIQVGKDAQAIAQDLMANPSVIDEVKKAVEGANKIPAEIKDLSLDEGLMVAKAAIEASKKMIAAAKAQ